MPFCQLCPPQILYMHLHVAYSNTLNEQVTQIAHSSLPLIHICHFQQQYNFTTYLTLQHTIQTQHCSCTPVFCMHAAKQIISAMLSMYIAATHNISYPPYISTCTTHRAIPTTLPLPQSSPTHSTNKHKHTCVRSPSQAVLHVKSVDSF